ncbi:27 kDa antigen Cfp30B [Maioricimonas rarisocia]|uniref:27 kDa antigen Cfp30B n=1 Tax=Maioricimonas rarisocia TaxID=2528026 RepID=A0A517ZG52_9PLAN|nr:VOC family protein [Maioricimonas rarisocia]QDU41422.1 27 kDa antigen Cfp30B [Maioricimonas rarisocia]
MARFTKYAPGQFCWVDLMAHDGPQALEFYGKLFGWEAEQQDTQGGPPYYILKLDGESVGGFGEMNPEMKEAGMPPVWSSYVNVEDAAATTERVEALGGQVRMPVMQVMDAGWMSVITDPAGAAVCLWQANQTCGATLANVPNTWCWSELLTPSVKNGAKFYEDLFGWTTHREEAGDDYWCFHVGGRRHAGALNLTPEMGPIPPHWGVYFSVANVQASCSTLTDLGGSVIRPPFEVGVGHIAVVTDPQGGHFNFIEMTVPADE